MLLTCHSLHSNAGRDRLSRVGDTTTNPELTLTTGNMVGGSQCSVKGLYSDYHYFCTDLCLASIFVLVVGLVVTWSVNNITPNS